MKNLILHVCTGNNFIKNLKVLTGFFRFSLVQKRKYPTVEVIIHFDVQTQNTSKNGIIYKYQQFVYC